MSDEAKLFTIGGCGSALLLCVCFVGCYGCSTVNYSDGHRDGIVEKFSQKGVVFKTWEGRLILTGFEVHGGDGGGVATARTFDFTVADPAVAEKLNALPPGKRVRVHYTEKLAAWGPKGNTSYFVTAVDDGTPAAK